MIDVLGFGICALDYMALVPRFPVENERLTLLESDVQGGGLVATAIVAAQRLGLRTAYAGGIGDDLEGKRVVEDLAAEGVDTRHVQVHPEARTRHSIIVVNPASMSRTILAHNRNAPVCVQSGELVQDARRAGVLFLDGSDPPVARELAAAARAEGVPVVIDADLGRDATAELAGMADIVIASRGYTRWATGADDPPGGAIELLGETGCRQVIVTAGEEGAWGVERRSDSAPRKTGIPGQTNAPTTPIHQAAFEVEVKDTTGAGDVFHGAYLVGVVEGWSLQKSMRFASAAAALKCRELGGRKGIPSRDEVEAFLQT